MRIRPVPRFLLLVAFATACALAVAARDELQPGAFAWTPDLSPRGPIVVLVRLQAQRAYVYRNGIRIGVSTVSTGRPGYETPPGIYTVLEKQREHRSNLYDDAPMPYMQRLTWDGMALHGGRVPGYPASHGCIRLPERFAETLYHATSPGTVVVVEPDGAVPTIESPGLFAPGGPPASAAAQPDATVLWQPGLAPDGPLGIVVSLRDRQVLVLRNAVRIGQAGFSYQGPMPTGTGAWVLLDDHLPAPSDVVADRPRLRWMRVASTAGETATLDPARLTLPQDFALALYDVLAPGTTVVVTDESFVPGPTDVPVLRGDDAAPNAGD